MPFCNLNAKQDRPAAGVEIISYKDDFSHASLILVNANRVDLGQVPKTLYCMRGRNHNTNLWRGRNDFTKYSMLFAG